MVSSSIIYDHGGFSTYGGRSSNYSRISDIVESMMGQFRRGESIDFDLYASQAGASRQDFYRHISVNYRNVDGMRDYLNGFTYHLVNQPLPISADDEMKAIVGNWNAAAATRVMEEQRIRIIESQRKKENGRMGVSGFFKAAWGGLKSIFYN